MKMSRQKLIELLETTSGASGTSEIVKEIIKDTPAAGASGWTAIRIALLVLAKDNNPCIDE